MQGSDLNVMLSFSKCAFKDMVLYDMGVMLAWRLGYVGKYLVFGAKRIAIPESMAYAIPDHFISLLMFFLPLCSSSSLPIHAL